MHRMMSIAALEYVGTGLRYLFDGLNESKPNEYTMPLKFLSTFPILCSILTRSPPPFSSLTFKLSTYPAFLPHMVKLGPAWFRKKLVDQVPWPEAHRVKADIYRMDDIAQDILRTIKQAFAKGESYGRGNLRDISGSVAISSRSLR